VCPRGRRCVSVCVTPKKNDLRRIAIAARQGEKRECVRERESEREGERECVCVCVCARAHESLCVGVCDKRKITNCDVLPSRLCKVCV